MEKFWQRSFSSTASASIGGKKQRKYPKPSSYSGDTIDEDQLMFELGKRSLKQSAGIPMKRLLAEEMSKDNESRRRSPSVIARLMGLDGLPPKKPQHNHRKRTETSRPKVQKSGAIYSRSSRKRSNDEQEFKDVSEVEVPFIQQKFMEAKGISRDEKSKDSEEFSDADSSMDIQLKFLRKPDSLFGKHLDDVQGATHQSRCGKISAMKSSHTLKNQNDCLDQNAGRETQLRHHNKSPQQHQEDYLSQYYGRYAAHSRLKVPKVRLEVNNGPAIVPTTTVVLKPNLGQSHSSTRTTSSPCSSHHYPSGCAGNFVNLESRKIAREITRQMKNRFSNGSMKISTSRFRGHAASAKECSLSNMVEVHPNYDGFGKLKFVLYASIKNSNGRIAEQAMQLIHHKYCWFGGLYQQISKMATRTVGLIQDQNLNAQFNAKNNVSKAQRKAGIGGRKPLGDLSDSVKTTPNQKSKKENAKTIPFIEKKIGIFNLLHDSSKTNSVCKAFEKVQATGRKALSDISNSGKAYSQGTLKKNQKAKFDQESHLPLTLVCLAAAGARAMEGLAVDNYARRQTVFHSVRQIIVGMSTWRLCSDDGLNYRWEAISPNLPSKVDDDLKGPHIAKYPSMADLLIEGCSKLIENDDREVDKDPMFRTEIANSVALKESSIAKAISILNEDDVASTDTPSGRLLSVSSEALQRARTLLGESDVRDLFGEMDEEFLHIEFTQRKNLTMRHETRKTTFLRPFPTKEQ
ncbi:putative Hydroxyproline-rich glycofamily protein [Hibiscus syriacus]|uniref:Hydroxyproline-rich glycofamily protein n=1 Tax=Hibiscus syriacus TaxID=106335 RepID=A0A6A3CDM4_HIBSY|nr:putative Hydroxyproline-rich glycofamily protein [Hibiscus syriacus]